MTMPRYPQGCAAGSQAPGIASAPADYAWIVNLDDGNANRNHQSNHNHVRAVCAGECHGQPSLRTLHTAWRDARRGKQPSNDRCRFEAHWLDNLLELQERLASGSWHPSPPTCFIATAPKAREIHAPAFADRLVHHWLVPQLEALYEPSFIHDSYSNRVGKGTHAAVKRLQAFVRQVDSGLGGGFYLQLDIKNFFNSIHRQTLYRLLKIRMQRAGVADQVQRCVHALLNYPISRTGVRWACTEAERAAVPPHKRLENAAPGCGIAIGNLSSQFFANVYLDRLDQFVKHELKAPRYLRYVDDFVLVHPDAKQLQIWQQQIETFLGAQLRLELKAGPKLAPLSGGIDFLGYVIYPHHTVVRRRVVSHCRARLAMLERYRPWATEQGRDLIRSVYASYAGHFQHAQAFRLRRRIHSRFPWLDQVINPPEAPHGHA